jgi:hypothetical protein
MLAQRMTEACNNVPLSHLVNIVQYSENPFRKMLTQSPSRFTGNSLLYINFKLGFTVFSSQSLKSVAKLSSNGSIVRSFIFAWVVLLYYTL